MFVRRLQDIVGTENDVDNANWRSRRLLLKKDGMVFSLHDTIIRAGTETFLWYKNHYEAVYCIEGRGEVEDTETGKVYTIEPGTLYVLDNHDKHRLSAEEDMRLICVFNPPCTGREVHDEDGSYPLLSE